MARSPGSSASPPLLAGRGGGGLGWSGAAVVCFPSWPAVVAGGRAAHGRIVFGFSELVWFSGCWTSLPAFSGSMVEPGFGAAWAVAAAFVDFWISSPTAWGSLFLFHAAGLYGCRAPAPLLQHCAGSTRRTAPSGSVPRWWCDGRGAATPSAARWTPEGPDRVFRSILGSFLHLCGCGLYFSSFRGAFL
jgi:hypothetical protein